MVNLCQTIPKYHQPGFTILGNPQPVLCLFDPHLNTFISRNRINKDPEVQDDWYKDKKAVRQDFARDEYASALSIQAQYSHTGKAVKFVINSTYNLDSNALPATLTLAFSHPTDSKRDLSTVLQKQDDGSYTTTLDRELTGRYYLTLSNTVWRLKDMVFLPFSEPITIKPEPIKS